ncbi:MAG: response regulator [Candidatus Hydrogenedentes bacterium]|nr:response regulator [Candidatus Hydrogenedentota bacterium]
MYRVIIADDDNQTAQFFGGLFDERLFKIKAVGSSWDLFAEIAASGPPHILITEIHLIDISVDELIRCLKRKCPASLIIIVTNDTSKETSARVRTQDVPIFYFGLKPLDTDEMKHVVSDAVLMLTNCKRAAGS